MHSNIGQSTLSLGLTVKSLQDTTTCQWSEYTESDTIPRRAVRRRANAFDAKFSYTDGESTKTAIKQKGKFMSARRIVLLLILVLAGVAVRARSQEQPADQKLPAGFRGEFLAQLKEVQGKVEALADAFPDDAYAWRPMEGVRSTREVLMHIAGANYLFPSFVGVAKPEGVPKDMEKTVTERAKVMEEITKSFDFIRNAVLRLSDGDLDKPAKYFGRESTVRDLYLNAGLHMHEHLGQLIAYARMNHIVPPWTAAEEAAQKGKTKKE